MPKYAKIYKAELSPGKPDIVRMRLGESARLVGTWRLLDPADEVGIEGLLAEDGGKLLQLPLTYRAAEAREGTLPEHAVTELDHSVLGRRIVHLALADSVAVKELLRTMLAADEGALPDQSAHKIMELRTELLDAPVQGRPELTNISLDTVTAEHLVGTVDVDGENMHFRFFFPRLLTVELPETAHYALVGRFLGEDTEYAVAGLRLEP